MPKISEKQHKQSKDSKLSKGSKLSKIHELRHRERRVTLPRNTFLFTLGIGLIVALYIVPHRTMMRILYMVMTTVVLAIIYMLYIKRRLHFAVIGPEEKIQKGEEVKLKIKIHNTSFLPSPYIYIFLKESYHLAPKQVKCLCVTLPGRQEQTYTIEYIGKYSGEEEIGIERIVLLDYLEMIRSKVSFVWKQNRIVLPQLVNLSSEQSQSRFLGEEEEIHSNTFMQHTDGEVSYELMPYQEGQPQRLVHWKLVAQRDIYMVRKREKTNEVKDGCLIIIDPVSYEVQPEENWRQKRFKEAQFQYRLKYMNEQAEAMDYRITACLSYLHEVLLKGEKIILKYYLKDEWTQKELNHTSDLEDIAEQVEKALMKQKIAKEDRLPVIDQKIGAYQVLISAGIDEQVEDYLAEYPNMYLLALQTGPLEYKGERYAYISKNYKIIEG